MIGTEQKPKPKLNKRKNNEKLEEKKKRKKKKKNQRRSTYIRLLKTWTCPATECKQESNILLALAVSEDTCISLWVELPDS